MKDERIIALIDLQKIVTEKYDLLKRHESVPARLDELDRIIGEAESKLKEAQKAVADNEALIRRSVREVTGLEEKLNDLQAKLNQVKTTREYESRQKEIKTHRNRMNELEEVVRNANDKTEGLHQQVETAKAHFEQISNQFADEIASLEGEDKKFEKILEAVESREHEARQLVPPDILERVHKLFLMRGGVGVVAINDGSCGGCGVQVSPQTIQLAKRGLDLIQCDRCSSYLYWDDELD
jgi:hypothetical protein